MAGSTLTATGRLLRTSTSAIRPYPTHPRPHRTRLLEHQTNEGRTLGKAVSLQLEFAMQEGGWMADHREIMVSKTGRTGFIKSKVDEIMGNVQLDSGDLKVEERHGELQRSAVHEFGHMLGLGDEYKDGHTYRRDRKSIMNSGMEVRARHLEQPRLWVLGKLNDYGLL